LTPLATDHRPSGADLGCRGWPQPELGGLWRHLFQRLTPLANDRRPFGADLACRGGCSRPIVGKAARAQLDAAGVYPENLVGFCRPFGAFWIMAASIPAVHTAGY